MGTDIVEQFSKNKDNLSPKTENVTEYLQQILD
jgi:hypothetical protein